MAYPVAYTNYSGIELPEEGEKSTTITTPLVRIGTGATAGTGMKIGTTAIPLVQIKSVTSLTAGNSQTMEITQTRLVTTASGNDYVMKVMLNSNVKTPGSACAIYGCTDLKTSGAAHGMASGICAEMVVPNSSLSRGALYCLELQLGGGASSSWASAGPVAFIYCGGWGSGVITEMDARGYLIDIQGFSEGSNKLVDNDGADPAATGGIRCRVGTQDIWLLYRDSAPA